MIKKFKKYPLPWVLGVLIGAMVLLPLLLRLSSVHAFLQCYLAPLGSTRTQYLAVFSTIVASFTAVMSAIMIQGNHERREREENEKREKSNLANCIRKLILYIGSIQSYVNPSDDTKKDQPPIIINIDGWTDYLSSLSILELATEKYSLFEGIFRNVERHNGFVERGNLDDSAKEEIANIDTSNILECVDILEQLCKHPTLQ